MLSIAAHRWVAMQILSPQIYVVRYHWRGRSLLCTGSESCVGCSIERPRSVFYVGANVKLEQDAVDQYGKVQKRGQPVHGVVELCQSAKVVIERCQRRFGKLVGLVVEMKRRTSRAEWESAGGYSAEPKNSIFEDVDIMRALAAVLRVDDPREGETFSSWLNGAANMHRGLMRGTQLVG